MARELEQKRTWKLNHYIEKGITRKFMSKKFKLSIKDEGFELELIKIKTTKEGDTYAMLLPQIMKGTGFHISAHKSGESHFKIKNPVKLTAGINFNKMRELAIEFFNEILKEPIDFSYAIFYYAKIHENKRFEFVNNDVSISLIDVLKRISILQVTSKDLLKRLLNLLKEKKLKEDKNFVIMLTNNGELIFYYLLSDGKLKEIINNSNLSNKAELITKYHGLIFTINISEVSGKIIDMAQQIMPGIKEILDATKDIANTNGKTIELDLENAKNKLIGQIGLDKEREVARV